MKPSLHLLVSLILAAILYPVFNWKALFILVGGVLIDIDHYLWYIYKYKKLSLFDSYKHFIINVKKGNFDKDFGALLIFHSIEFLAALVVLSFYNEFVLALTIGLLMHNLLDLIWTYFVPKRFIITYSIIYWLTKNKIQNL
jgi:hypothetical protein|tara:strand:- start:471 stop:893 length:423 start_codon:yes stop_codon:yes gene_type:complete